MKVYFFILNLFLIIFCKNTFFSVYSESGKSSALSFMTNQLDSNNKYTLKVKKNQTI